MHPTKFSEIGLASSKGFSSKDPIKINKYNNYPSSLMVCNSLSIHEPLSMAAKYVDLTHKMHLG